MVQHKPKRGTGVKTPSQRSFWCGTCEYTVYAHAYTKHTYTKHTYTKHTQNTQNYRAAKTHRMLCLYRSFSAKEPRERGDGAL